MKPGIDFTNSTIRKLSKSNIYMSDIKVEKVDLVDEKAERKYQRLERRKEKLERKQQKQHAKLERRKEKVQKKREKMERRFVQYEAPLYVCEPNQALNLIVPLKHESEQLYTWVNNEVHQGELNKVVCAVKERRPKEIVIGVENNGKVKASGRINIQIEYLKESFFSRI